MGLLFYIIGEKQSNCHLRHLRLLQSWIYRHHDLHYGGSGSWKERERDKTNIQSMGWRCDSMFHDGLYCGHSNDWQRIGRNKYKLDRTLLKFIEENYFLYIKIFYFVHTSYLFSKGMFNALVGRFRFISPFYNADFSFCLVNDSKWLRSDFLKIRR